MYRKRERTQNWTLEEKKYLLELVKSRLDVLENKRIDSASSALKGMAWQDIHASFAARFGNDRDAHRVREQWRRMKGQARTEMMEFADRVRTFGAAVANQRWPTPLAEEVWNTLETARSIGEANQGCGAGDDNVSPITMDDDEDDADDVLLDGDGCNRSHDMDFSIHNNGIKTEPPDFVDGGDRFEQLGSFARIDHDHHGDPLELRDFRDHDVSIVGEEIGAAGLMSMLRPKVELNDVPDLDTSMVPSGLSITAVKVEGSGGQSKRRLMERLELPSRTDLRHDVGRSWDSGHGHDGAGPAGRAPAAMPPPGAPHRAPPGRTFGHGLSSGATTATANHLSPPVSVLESKRLEQRRRHEMLEEEHRAKMELLRVEQATAEVRRRIALREEASAAASALTCRSCGADRGVEAAGARYVVKRRPSNAKSDAPDRDVADLDLDNEHGDNNPTVTSTPSPDRDRGSGELANGIEIVDQVRFAGGLGEPGSGAGKGGGAGGSIREAGGSMGKREAAFEDEYFYKQQKEQLKKLKSDLADEIGFHEEQIKRHQEAISRHKQRVSDLDKDK